MKLKLLTHAILILGSAYMTETYAACTLGPNASTVDVPMNVGRIVITPSTPLGVIKKQVFPYTGTNFLVTCDAKGGKITAALSKPLKLSSYDKNVYLSNIPGIGIRLYREVTQSDPLPGTSDYYPYDVDAPPNKSYHLGTGYFVVEILKVANVTGSGAFTPGRYSSYYSKGHPLKPLLTSTVYGNAITIASSSCEIQGNIYKIIQLPKVTKDQFKGIGTTAGERNFSFDILCNGGKNPSDLSTSNKISLSFDFTANSDLKSIVNSATPKKKANGISTQIINKYKNANTVITKGSTHVLGSVNSNQSVTYNVPLSARYIQTGQNITAGLVQGSATVTIEYE